MAKVDYDERLHAVYGAGRQMSLDARQTWMEAFARHLPETRPLAWLDLVFQRHDEDRGAGVTP